MCLVFLYRENGVSLFFNLAHTGYDSSSWFVDIIEACLDVTLLEYD